MRESLGHRKRTEEEHQFPSSCELCFGCLRNWTRGGEWQQQQQGQDSKIGLDIDRDKEEDEGNNAFDMGNQGDKGDELDNLAE